MGAEQAGIAALHSPRYSFVSFSDCVHMLFEIKSLSGRYGGVAIHVVVVRLKPNFHNCGSTSINACRSILTQLRPTERTFDYLLYAQMPSPVVTVYLNSVSPSTPMRRTWLDACRIRVRVGVASMKYSMEGWPAHRPAYCKQVCHQARSISNIDARSW
jgi:hypothetical protein